ncbi:MAG: type II toxin-antitoxin system HicB family antitoxin [Anaerolineae bacterium]
MRNRCALLPALPGLWGTGKSLAECRRNLAAALEDWVVFSLARGMPLPEVGGVRIDLPVRLTP